MRDLSELNINEGGRPVSRPPPTPEDISRIEELVGAKLPSEYVAFLIFSNGGHPELDVIAVNGAPRWGVDRFFHVSSDAGSALNIFWNYHAFRRTGIDKSVLPIAANGGGDLFCLDLSEAGDGKVILWIHDVPGGKIVQVADSFEELIDRLIIDPDAI
jgi:hypothetical protein